MTRLRDNIPQELRERDQWVVWRWEGRDGNRTKPPRRSDNLELADSTDPRTWSDFATAVAQREAGKVDGVGFAVSIDPFCGIDLDHCRDPKTGAIEPWAQAIIDRFNSYTEVTPSGTGIRIWITGQWIVGHNRKGNIEIYDQGRYFTVTGQHLVGTPLTIEYRATELMALRNELWPTIPGPILIGPPRPTSGLSVYEILELARQHKNAGKWDRLMRGDTSDYASPSEADAALCALAAFYTRDPMTIDQLVRMSGLSREKWDRQDYRERTVGAALELVTERYEPGGEIRHGGKTTKAGTDDKNTHEDEAPADWSPVDLGPFVRGDIKQPEPICLARTDGILLLYPGKAHWISGEPEGCKTWLVLVAVAEVLDAGGTAFYIDFEGDAATITERLLALGVSAEAIEKHLVYIRPESPMTEAALEDMMATVERAKPIVSVIDGVNAAMGTSGLDSNTSRDFYRWWAQLGRPLQHHTNGPLVAVDHVVKDPNARGSYAAGTGQKQAAIDVHIGVEVKDQFGIGLTGRMRLVLHKDRAGRLRQYQSPDKTIGVLVLESDAETHAIQFEIEPPTVPGAGKKFRPTVLMEKVSRYMEEANDPRTKNRIKLDVSGKAQYVLEAVDRLYEEGYLTRDVSGRYTTYTTAQSYREADEDASE